MWVSFSIFLLLRPFCLFLLFMLIARFLIGNLLLYFVVCLSSSKSSLESNFLSESACVRANHCWLFFSFFSVKLPWTCATLGAPALRAVDLHRDTFGFFLVYWLQQILAGADNEGLRLRLHWRSSLSWELSSPVSVGFSYRNEINPIRSLPSLINFLCSIDSLAVEQTPSRTYSLATMIKSKQE